MINIHYRVKPLLNIVFTFVGLVLTLITVNQIGLQVAYQDLHKQSTQHLNTLISYIDNTLGRFEKIPEVLSKHPLLQEVLNYPSDQEKTNRLNLFLEEMSNATQASDIFLINTQGRTIAASNWRKENSFVGDDLRVRPYFKNAIKGNLARYYAVGLTSNKRGYYFAYPIKDEEKIIGVIAIKVRIDDIENQHAQNVGSDNYNFLIVAPDDVVFISNREEWRLNKINIKSNANPHLDNTDVSSTLIDPKRYAERKVSQLNILEINKSYLPNNSNVHLYQLLTGNKKEMVFSQHAKMQLTNWHVHIWSSLEPIKEYSNLLVFIGSGGYLLFVILILFSKERIRNHRQQHQATLLLEKRVKERTEDLTTINQMLTAEMAAREKTQQELNSMQEELIQAAKLAMIGNMSASINHEINQPLTAIKSYSTNALTYQERNMPDKVTGNLQHIIALTNRLANIVSQFKNFTKKSSGIQTPVLVQTSINETLAIIKHQAQKELVKIVINVPSDDFYVLGDGIRLEQVFVNIVSNGMQAMKGTENKQIHIEIKPDSELLCISFRDTGPGILADNIDKIFEPFFTTKERHGLGVGLSISQRIIESMQGKLIVKNHPLGGAVFIISLPLYQNKPNKQLKQE